MAKQQSIKEYFKGKNIFLTGGSGFLGKILVEKLLRSCSDLNTLYLLMRPKKNVNVHQRWKNMTDLPDILIFQGYYGWKSQDTFIKVLLLAIPREKNLAYMFQLFDKLKAECPETLNKVHLVEGNVEVEGIGLAKEERELIIKNVNIIYHNAAAVQFSEDLIYSLLHNTGATYNMVEFAKSFSNLEIFVYISTTYCNSNRHNSKAEEIIYPTPWDWEKMLHVLRNNPYELSLLQNKIKFGHATTYTMSKALAEQIVNDYSKYFRTLIIRPSIILGVLEDPLTGWVDSLNGVTSVALIALCGAIRVMRTVPPYRLDYISADHCVRVIISGTWFSGKEQKSNGLEIIGCNYGKEFSASFDELIEREKQLITKYPSSNMIWYPFFLRVSNPLLFKVVFFFLQVLPSIVGDLILRLRGKQPMLVSIAKKFLLLHHIGDDICSNKVDYRNDNMKKLSKVISEEEKNEFGLDLTKHTLEDIIEVNTYGLFKYFLKEDISEETFERRKRHVKRLEYIHHGVCILLLVFLGYIFHIVI